MPINAHPEYITAEKVYLEAETNEQKITALKEMISKAPSHKGAENLRAQLKKRLVRLKGAKEKENKKKKGKGGIKKEDMQCVIVGKTNAGKSSLLKTLTNAKPEISQKEFATKKAIVGIMNYNSVQIQLIDIPAIGSEEYDKGIVYTADVILIIINSLKDLKSSEEQIRTQGKKLIVFNKSDLLSNEEKRKISANLQSKRYNYQLISTKTKEGIEELEEKIFLCFKKIRVYTKEPGKDPDKKRPIILNPESTTKDVAEKILKGFSNQLKQIKIWGPSSKFPGQIVGLKHKLKDLDIVEFKTK
jgi:small GTP-binding protein